MAPATLKAGPKMAVAREGQAAVRLADGRVLILGGSVTGTGKCEMACIPTAATASVEIYDPRTGNFSPNGSLAQPRAGGQALLLKDGRVLVAGSDPEYGSVGTIEIYDPGLGRSVVVKPPSDIPYLPTDPTVVLLADGRVLIAGGLYPDQSAVSNATLIFDPVSGGISHGPLMARPREGATATLLDDGRVLIVGGADGHNGDAQNLAELIDPSHPLAQSTFPVYQGRPTSTLLSDGRVLVAGGGPDDFGARGGRTPGVSEVFDPRTERFTQVGPMSTPRTGPIAIGIPDGRVLFFGGVDSNGTAVGTVEAFDPNSGTFQVVATGFPEISGFSATLLDDGEILIAGGQSSDWEMAAASWLLTP
jgi:large repetitive protein